MTDAIIDENANSGKSKIVATTNHLRIWPGVILVMALWLLRLWANSGEPAPSKFFFGLIIAPAAVTLGVLLWWLFASRIQWTDRLLGAGMFLVIATATCFIAGKDFPAMGLILYALPVISTAWVVWLIVSGVLPWSVRRAGLMLIFVATGCLFSCLRVDGMDGSFKATFNWRWTPTSEDKLLTDLKSGKKAGVMDDALAVQELTIQPGDWPCFRGPQRDSRLTEVHIQTDWATSPPKELWRHRIGPGWSSCSIVGKRLFTQEQRGQDEFIVCYDADTGGEIWSHSDAARFEEVVAGAGPRGTPTFHEGRIYTLGAKGLLNSLDATTGKVVWSADIVRDTKAEIPQWGFSSSPLISHGVVSVFAGGPNKKTVVAYRVDTGELAWPIREIEQVSDKKEKEETPKSYCSTQLATFDGVEQILITTNAGLTSYDPKDGSVMWEHGWPVDQARVVQPAILGTSDILLGTGMSGGTRRLNVSHDSGEWKIKELWTTKSIKPYYNDFVISGDYLYGFDNNIFMCVDLNDGKIRWRARGYGNGQVLLLAADNLLLILTETGEVALVEAKPEQHNEIAKFKAIEGKTWNHPVVAHEKLFVRNAEEIACFALPYRQESSQPANDNDAQPSTSERGDD